MLRLQLKCIHGDYFDAWFCDHAAFAVQRTKGQVMCPHCGEIDVDEAPPLKPGLYPDLTEDQARQMSCDTRRMLEGWIGRPQGEEVSESLVVHAVNALPLPPAPTEPAEPPRAEVDPIDGEPEPPRAAAPKPSLRAFAYDC